MVPIHFVCEGCGTALGDRQPGTWMHLASCWVQIRTGGGAHGIRDGREDGRRLCNICMDLQHQADQLELFP